MGNLGVYEGTNDEENDSRPHGFFPLPKLEVYAGSITQDHEFKISRASRIRHLDRAVFENVATLPEAKTLSSGPLQSQSTYI